MAVNPDLISLDQAKAHLRVSSTDEDDDLLLKVAQATDIVLNYVGYVTREYDWDEDTVPAGVQAAILNQVRILYETDRKDADAVSDFSGHQPDGYLHPSVTRYLHRYRDPALA